MLYGGTFLNYTLCTTKLLRGILFSLRPSFHPAFCVRSVNPTILDGFFSYLAQMITSMRGLHIMAFDLDLYLQIKLQKYVTSCVCFTGHTVWDGFFLYLAQIITNMRGCVVCNDLWPWHISSRSFSHDFAIKLLKYGTSCCVYSRACAVLDEFHVWHK